MLPSANHAQYCWRAWATGSGGRLIAAVAHCTAVATSLPLDNALKAPWAAAWHALAGAPPRFAQANHSAYDRSSAVGPTGACGPDLRGCSTTCHVGLAAGGCDGAAGCAGTGAAGTGDTGS